ncbi:hypothetical protein LOD99_16054 [Oopsacas minuta]|uniref:AIG1-type G domain-containing protein n=1 Tax=Oopsacas minuta TaxID=111878 RepID=A0AAV7K681_9METZ|nr:hypothetical protein LOD99_16054 [Oopsacas minuta]
MGNKNSVDRSFIFIGKMGDGKSSLGNLLCKAGRVPKDPFKVPENRNAMGTTQKIEFVEVITRAGVPDKDEEVKIQLFDIPGLNDPKFKLATHSMNITQCIRRATPTLFVTFVIVIDISAESMDPDFEPSIVALSRELRLASFSFFNQAVVVFTHADKLVGGFKRDKLDQKLKEKCISDKWGDLDKILTRVDGRYMYVNTKRKKGQVEVMQELYQLSITTLRLLFQGNTNFKASEIKKRLGLKGENNIIDQKKYKIECLFSSDLQLHLQGQKIEITEEVQNAIKDLKLIGHGISVIIILIDLTNAFTTTYSEMIRNLPNQYENRDRHPGGNKFWDYTFIVFKVHNPNDVERQIRQSFSNPEIKRIYKLAGGRHTWVAKNDPNIKDLEDERKDFIKRIIDCYLQVKKVTQGKNYISNVVAEEMEMMTQEMYSEARSSSQLALIKGMEVTGCMGAQCIGALGTAGVLGGVGAVAGPIGAVVGGVTGGLIGFSGVMTVQFAIYILQKVKPTLLNHFKLKFSNLEKISNEAFLEFLERKEYPEIAYDYVVIDNIEQTNNILPAKDHEFRLETDHFEQDTNDTRDTRQVPGNTPLIPENAQLIPDDTPLIPEDAQLISYDTPLIPEDAQLISYDTPLIPEDTPLISYDTPLIPEDAQLISYDTPLIPEDTPLISYDTPLIPEDTPLISYDTPLIPEDAQLISYDTPLISYDAQLISYDTPLISYDAQLISYDTPLIPEDTPLISYDTPLIPEDAQLISYDTPLISYDTLLISENTPLIPNENPPGP